MSAQPSLSGGAGFPGRGGSSSAPVADDGMVNAEPSGKSSGKFPADPWAFYRCFRDRWPEFIRHNFRNTTDAAAFFNVDESTVRGWLSTTSPRGQVVAYAIAAMPAQSREFMVAA